MLKIFEFHLRIFPILKLYATQWFSRAKIKRLLQNIWNMSWEFQRIKFKAPLNLFSIWNRSSCIFYFLAFWSILEISRNSRTFGESWRFRYFHIWESSRIWKEDHLIYLFHLQLFFRYQKKYERGNNMTLPKYRKNEDLMNKSNFGFARVLFVFYLDREKCAFSKIAF